MNKILFQFSDHCSFCVFAAMVGKLLIIMQGNKFTEMHGDDGIFNKELFTLPQPQRLSLIPPLQLVQSVSMCIHWLLTIDH